ncbi:hypothetical protein N657DRAFT_641035 [Parathielavia appendiculata]|uniref:Secreted protein n=1 Tax=Parathielavia appendiculata TaxID=2587402 RepID=A0AAN6Z635_9PEZI|nr:hypothetical protein N657DRAFT_641035 [Parathielavia appendiculata]
MWARPAVSLLLLVFQPAILGNVLLSPHSYAPKDVLFLGSSSRFQAQSILSHLCPLFLPPSGNVPPFKIPVTRARAKEALGIDDRSTSGRYEGSVWLEDEGRGSVRRGWHPLHPLLPFAQ